ncbi:MAG: RNA methyltransferase [Bacteroidetes bacterium]|nr:RNA methyltransferase [Bacteroidota bacterium]
MIGRAKFKWIKSLQLKKYRQSEQCFLVQGRKSVEELLRSDFNVMHVLAAKGTVLPDLQTRTEIELVSEKDLATIGSFQSNDSVLAVARMKEPGPVVLGKSPVLVLDDIRDPGNLGTIIRTADWFGFQNIIASHSTVDFYNPKVIAATMGSFCRVNIFYTDLALALASQELNIFGAFLNGKNLDEVNFGKNPIVVVGNESTGISAEVERLIKTRVTIPGKGQTESLNAAVAAGILMYAAHH